MLQKYHNGFETSTVASVTKATHVAGLVLAKKDDGKKIENTSFVNGAGLLSRTL